ncbi:MAG: glycosyltransferase family protein [Kurthia sp.]|nr:glycosyltransferase family protein [Candidatus Kurthia equi]
MKIVAIVQARMGSTRLPGKVLKEVLSRPLLSFQIERMKQSKLVNELVIATTPHGNEKIIQLCEKEIVPYFVGSESDVLDRYYKAGKKYEADVIVRMTSDCPLIDPVIIDQVIQMYLDGNYDYVSNTQDRTFPRGMDVEVFSMEALEKAFEEAIIDYEHEHVTPYIYLNRDKFSIGQYTQVDDKNDIRLTVDTNEDFLVIKKIFNELYNEKPNFLLDDILAILEKYPEWKEINKNIIQKKLGE